MVAVQKNFLVIFKYMYVTITNRSKGPEFYIIRLDVLVGSTSINIIKYDEKLILCGLKSLAG